MKAIPIRNDDSGKEIVRAFLLNNGSLVVNIQRDQFGWVGIYWSLAGVYRKKEFISGRVQSQKIRDIPRLLRADIAMQRNPKLRQVTSKMKGEMEPVGESWFETKTREARERLLQTVITTGVEALKKRMDEAILYGSALKKEELK